MNPLSALAGLSLAAAAVVVPSIGTKAHAPPTRADTPILVSNNTDRCAWITFTSRAAKDDGSQIKGGGEERKKTGPLWIAGKSDYTFHLSTQSKIRAEVQLKDCKGRTGDWDTGNIAGGNVYDTDMTVEDKVNKSGQYHLSLQKGNGKYYFSW
jgi:hypothetical protein